MLITAKEVATLTALPLQRVYQLARGGAFDGVLVRFGGRQVKFDSDSLTAWIKAGGFPSRTETENSMEVGK